MNCVLCYVAIIDLVELRIIFGRSSVNLEEWVVVRADETGRGVRQIHGIKFHGHLPVRFLNRVSSDHNFPLRSLLAGAHQILNEGLIFAPHNGSKCGLCCSDHLKFSSSVVTIHYFKSQRLMFLKVISNDEALLEVWVQVVFHFLCTAEESPLCLRSVRLLIDKAYWV